MIRSPTPQGALSTKSTSAYCGCWCCACCRFLSCSFLSCSFLSLSNLWIILGAWRCLPSTLAGAGLRRSHQRFGTVLSASEAAVTARRAASVSSAVEACLKDGYAAERSEQASGRSSSLLNSFFRTTTGTCLTQQGEYSCAYEDQQIKERRI